jgi:hypothetical protein
VLRRCFTVALAGVVLLPILAPLGVQAAPNIVPPPATAEEISLASLGFGSQVIHGPSPSLDVRFPAPAAALATSGSYLRIFFGHSPLVSTGSHLQVRVNGQLLDEVALTDSTAAGSVFVLEVPSVALHRDQPNLAEFDFSLVAAVPSAAPDLFGRVDADTAMHVQMAAATGTIEAYPYSLLGGSLVGSLGKVELGAVIPSAPDNQELAAALRLVADAGRRLRGATVHVSVVSEAQESWLRSGSSPALLVGRVADLPGSASVLRAAGFTSAAGRWTAPGATAPIPAEDGIIAAVISPWDSRSPMLLVTGATDSAVARAAAAVVDPQPNIAGHAAVVSDVASGPPIGPPDVPWRTLLPGEMAIRGAGDHVIVFAVPVPTVAAPFPTAARLTLTIGGSAGTPVKVPDITVDVDGHAVRALAALGGAGAADVRNLDIRPELRPGLNTVTLNLRLPDGAGEVLLDTALTDLQVRSPSAASTLDQLPAPFLGASGDTLPTVALADLRPTTIAGAVSAMAQLGERAVVAPAPLSVITLGRDAQLPRHVSSVIVIGGPAGESLRLRSGAFRTEVISPPATVAGGRMGWIAEVLLTSGVPALWVGGDPQTLVATAMALANPGLRGQLAIVQPDGQARNLIGVGPGSAAEPVTIGLARLLPLLIGAPLLLLTGLEIRRRRRPPA